MGGEAPCAAACAQRVGSEERPADTHAVIVAGGTGERFGDPRGKQFVELCGLPLMCWSIVAFDRAPSVAGIVVVCSVLSSAMRAYSEMGVSSSLSSRTS